MKNLPIVRPGLLASSLLLAATGLTAQESPSAWTERSTLVGGEGSSTSFGFAVALDGDRALLASDGDVLRRSGSGWIREARLHSISGASTNNGYGAVCLDGTRALVGAVGDNLYGFSSGAAFVFRRSGSVWTEEARLPRVTQEDDNFGSSVALSGDTAVVSAVNTIFAYGSATVFRRTGATWQQEDFLLPVPLSLSESFGSAVALDGDTVFVGAETASTSAVNSGAVYVFQRSGTSWNYQTKLEASDTMPGGFFGHSLAHDGDTLLVGAIHTANASCSGCRGGAAYVFVRDGSTWTEQAKLTAPAPETQDQFGWRVAVAGDRALVGAFQDDAAGFNSGNAFLFERTGTAWSMTDELTPAVLAAGDWYGAVALQENRAVVGAWGADRPGRPNAGAAFEFTPAGTYATSTVRNAGSNPASYTASPAVLGGPWQASVDLASTGHSFAQIRASSATSAFTFAGGQVLLIGTGPTALFTLPTQSGPSATWTGTIPNDPGLGGLTAYTQALQFGGVTPFALSNARDLLIGY